MPPEDIRIDSFMLADAAKSFDGKLYIHGGGWNRLTIYDPASTRPITVVGRVIIPKTNEPQKYLIEIHLQAAIDQTIIESQQLGRFVLDPFTSSPGAMNVESSTPFVIEIPGVAFGSPGEYEFVAVSDGEIVATTLLHVEFKEPLETSAMPIAAVPGGGDEAGPEQWSDREREEWAHDKLLAHGVEPSRGEEESEIDYRERLVGEIVRLGYDRWELTPEGPLYLFNVTRPASSGSSAYPSGSTSVTGAGKTVEEAMLMTLAIVLDMMDR